MTDRFVTSLGERSRTSSTLLRSAASRDAKAWDDLVDQYGPLVYRLCRRQGLQPACANDVVQDVFVAVSKSLEEFRHDRPGDSFRSWLLTIAWNKLRDRGRQATRWAKAEGGTDAQLAWMALAAPESDSTTQGRLPSERALLVQQAMAKVRNEVSEEKWALFCAVVIDGCTADEAATIHGTTVNVVYLAKSRILHRLRQELNSESTEEM